MNDNWEKVANIKSINIDYKTFKSLPKKVQEYIAICAHCGVPNPQSQFNNDDIVIRTFGLENMVDTDPYGVPLKWKVAASVYGLVIGRKVRPDKLGGFEIVNNLNIPNAKAKIDPDYLNSLILQDETFDPSEQRKTNLKERKKASRHNKSISKRIPSIGAAEEFLSSLSIGDKFYIAKSYLKLTTSSRLLIVRSKFNGHAIIVSDADLQVSFYYDYAIRAREIVERVVAMQEPYPLSKIIHDETI
jgi:hypothetical protein